VTASLSLYRLATRLLEPAAPWLVEQRLKSGKERPDRINERFGLTKAARPDGPLIWMHGASVGECRLLLDVFAAIRKQRPDVTALVTSQTLTAADMVAGWSNRGVTHQMAPVDGPVAVERFIQHWRPNAVVFAEGEIWPNMLSGIKAHAIPAALINARMTRKTLATWKRRPAASRELFSTFGFIGAADEATAYGLVAAGDLKIEALGNLKTAAVVDAPPASAVAAFREATGNRPIVLAASTHSGEEEFALDAFTETRARAPGVLLILVPRHPERGSAIVELSRGRGLTTQQWSSDKSPPGTQVDVLVADTIGELIFWYAASDSIYLGGATADGIGGHNAIEPAQLGKRVFTGPHGFNFAETFEALAKAGALQIGSTQQELSAWWLNDLSGTQAGANVGDIFVTARFAFERSLAAILGMLEKRA
jgi:3-deoxy-D-manno-octulosonic-acid transferase